MKKVHLPLRTYLVLLVLGTLVPLLVFATALALVNGRLQRTASDDELQETARALAVAVDAMPSPSCLTNRMWPLPNPSSTTINMSAAMVMRRPVAASPRATLPRGST